MNLKSFVGRAATAAVELLPAGIRDRLIGGAPELSTPGPSVESESRLLILPTNSAGQATRWAAAVREFERVDAANLMLRLPTSFAHPADLEISRREAYLSRSWQDRFFAWAGTRFTHVLLESGSTITGPPSAARASREIRRFERAGLRVGLIFHGSDIRDVDAHARRDPDSPYRGEQNALASALRGVVARNREILAAFPAAPRFVSTPDLLLDLPGAALVPVIPEPEFLAPASAPPARKIPVVAHIPSNAAVKGTDLVRPAMHRLADAGIIEYRELSGLDRAQLRAAYADADIILDQFRLGSYGVAAVEGLGLGRTVVGHVSADVRAEIERRAGIPLPIVEASGAEIESVVRGLVDPGSRAAEQRRALAEGPAFVRVFHGGSASASALHEFLQPGKSVR